MTSYTLRIKIAPWFLYGYLPAVKWLSVLTGLELDQEKVNYWFRKATKFKEIVPDA